MSLLKQLATDNTIHNETDSVGGANVLDSGIYNFTITMAYLNKATSGALGLVVSLKTDDKKEMRQTFWMTSGTAKGGKNYYEKDGQKHYLPGFNQASSLCLLACGKDISDLDTEEKVIPVWNSVAKAEVPTKVDALTDLIGKEIIGGVLKQLVDKNVKNDAGVYVPSGDTREENEVDKFFRAKDSMTTAEIRAAATEATFVKTWAEKHTGNVKDKSTKGVVAGVAGAPKAAGSGGKPTTSLFGS